MAAHGPTSLLEHRTVGMDETGGKPVETEERRELLTEAASTHPRWGWEKGPLGRGGGRGGGG